MVNDDNYVLFTSDINGHATIPGTDGYLYTIGSTVSKIRMEDRSVAKSLLVTLGDYPIHMAQGALSRDNKFLVVSRAANSGGPNCRPLLTFQTASMAFLGETCIAFTGETIFAPILTDMHFLSNTELVGSGNYENYNSLRLLFFFKATIQSNGSLRIDKMV